MTNLSKACRVLSFVAIGLIVGNAPARAQAPGWGIGYWKGVTAPTFGSVTVEDAGCIGWADTKLCREAVRHIMQRDGTNPERASWANTYTSATNYEAFSVDWQTVANVALVGTRTAATGTSRALRLFTQETNAAAQGTFINLDHGALPFIRMGVATTTLGDLGLASQGTWIQVAEGTSTATANSVVRFAITPTYNQTSGTAANTDLLINRTETAVGSGAQNLFAAQVGSVDRFVIRNTGRFFTVQQTLGSNVYDLSSTATNDDPTENFFQNRVATTDATVTTIQSITIPATTTVGINCTIVNRRTGGGSGTAEDGAYYEIKVALKNVAGTATEIAAETVTVIGESQAGWTVTAAPSSGNELIQVTGAAGNNITWHSHCRTYPIGS